MGSTRFDSRAGVDSPERGSQEAPGSWKKEQQFLAGVGETKREWGPLPGGDGL